MATFMRCVRAVTVRTVPDPTSCARASQRFIRVLRRRGRAPESAESGVKGTVTPAPESCPTVAGPVFTRATEAADTARKQNGQRAPAAPVTVTEHAGDRGTSLKRAEGVWYDRASPGDKRVSRLVALARSRKLREQQGKVLLYGWRLILDAVRAGVLPHTIFFSSTESIKELPLHKFAHNSFIRVSAEELRIWPDSDAPFDVIAVFRGADLFQMQLSEERRKTALPLTLICDNVRDPGNMGMTLRCAAAAGCYSVLLTKGCVDIWDPKVLRAALGSHFQLPIIPNLTWGNIHTHLLANSTVHVADNCGGNEVEPATPRQQSKAGDYGWVRSRHNSKQMHFEEDDDEDCVGGVCMQTSPVLETQPYYASWVGGHTVVVIGGETHGLSQDALRLSEKTGGRRLLIPMVRGVDSLNSAMAASVLLFEGRRQLTRAEEQTAVSYFSFI